MKSILKNKKEFKPVFLYSNKEYSKKLISQLRADEVTIKTTINSIKKIRPHLQDETVINCLKNGFDYFSEVIKEDHTNYPHAEISILLSLEGVKPELADEVKENLSKIKRNRLGEYNISGNDVKLKPETIQEIEKQSERYTTSEKQNEALETLNIIASNMNKAIESGVISSERIGSNLGFAKDLLVPFGNKMDLKRLDSGKWGIQPNLFKVSMI